jgi:putative membrane protein
MEYMFTEGFLGTRAPLFMDVVTLIVAVLPLLVYGAIVLARKKLYKVHAFMQNIIFIVSVIVVGYFEYGVRIGGGFDAFIKGSGVSHTYASIVLGLHVIIAILTLIYWSLTVVKANYQFSKELIPGPKSNKHKLLALKTFLGIVFTSFSGIWVYLLLFVY